MTDSMTDPTPDLRARILAFYADPDEQLPDDQRAAAVRTVDSLPDEFFELAEAAAKSPTLGDEMEA
jgi:hypothetical protein